MKNILFVCTGNTCRSSMAEAIFKNIIKEAGEEMKGIKVKSAGLFVIPNQPASEKAIEIMKKKGINLTNHKTAQLTIKKIEEADLILTMTAEHKKSVINISPESKEKVFTLKEYGFGNTGDILDPFGKNKKAYEKTAEQIEQAIKKIIQNKL